MAKARRAEAGAMPRFTTIDLGTWYNAKADRLDWPSVVTKGFAVLPHGQQVFWGIPFHLGPAEGKRWLLLESRDEKTVIPLMGTATYIVIAHFCDEARR